MTWRLLAGRAFVERARWGPRADRPALLERSLRAALVESRGRYKDLVELSSDFAFEIDGRGRFAFVSPKGALGYSADDLVGLAVADLGLDPARAGDLVAAFAPRQGPGESEVWVRAKSGVPRLLSVTAAPVSHTEAGGGPAAGTRGIARDITQAHAQAQALARADLRERLLLRILRAAEDEVDPAKAILAVAAAIALATGSGCRVFAADGLIAAVGDGPRASAVISAPVGAPTETDMDGGRALMAPVRHRGIVLGTLVLWRSAGERPFDADEQTLVAALAGHIGLLLAQADAQRELGRLARTDALTGLANRRAFVDETERRLARIRSGQGCAALVLIDLDNFKPINDRLGHAMGDEALVAVAREFGGAVRGFDIAARFGGDEFALWLEGADRTVAVTRAEALAAAAPSLVPGAVAAGVPLGMSAGIVAVSAGESATLAELMRKADTALYAAKAAGKGCVREAEP